MKALSYDLRPCSPAEVEEMCRRFHGYGGAGRYFTYAFAVYEDDRAVAVYAWQPPPPGAAKAVCPDAPHGVLALSRMAAVPRKQRRLNHVSKPLRRQMKALIDRTRWPVLVTYSDEGVGHIGHVYKCSGWKKTRRTRRPYFVDEVGRRASVYSNGGKASGVCRAGTTYLQRWEHWICSQEHVVGWVQKHGWRRCAVRGKTWRSGKQAFTWIRKCV